MRAIALAGLAILLLTPTAAFAHAGHDHGQVPLWTFDPWIIVPLLTTAILYAAGVFALWSRVGAGRGIRPWQVAVYAGGWLALAGALVSPLHWLGEHLFTFHMMEHEIVMAVAAPLMAVARPAGAFLWGLPIRVRRMVVHLVRHKAWRAVWTCFTRPSNATIIHGLAIWVWHAPPLFDAAVQYQPMHRLQHLSFFATALLFWWSLVRRSPYGVATWHLFVAMIHTTVLGALLTLAPRVLYVAQTANALRWGLTPLQDQQLAGIVMWVPAGTIYAGAALAFAALWISRSRTLADPQALRHVEL